MNQPPRLLLACSLLCGVASWMPAAVRAAEPEAEASSVAAKARPSFPVMRADHLPLYRSAQTGAGQVWAIGYRGDQVVLRWSGTEWITEESVTSWPTRAETVGIAADPQNPDAVLSLSRTSNSGQEKRRGRFQLRRHRAGQPSVFLSDFIDPTGSEDGRLAGAQARFTVDAWGRSWLTFRAPWVASIPPDGGAPTVAALKEELFKGPLKGRKPRALDYTGTSASEGWLWTVPDDARGEKEVRIRGELLRPLRVVNGEPREEIALPAGLPTEPRVTLIRPEANGATIWAVEGEGLWRVDAAGETAVRRDSPPDAWRIVDWRMFTDGTEVALVIDPVRRRDLINGRILVRRDGRWLDAGTSGTTTISMDIHPPAGPSHFDWSLSDGLLLGAGFSLRLVAADLNELSAGKGLRMRLPDWRTAFPVTECSRVHPLPGGELLIQGASVVVTTPEELRAGWRAAEHGVEPAAHEFHQNAHRAPDGRLWMPESVGEGAPKVRHWDGARWHEWPMPEMYSPNGSVPILWVDEIGRIALFSLKLDGPAWERRSSGSGVWRRFESGWKLIEARAADPEKARTVRPLGQQLPFQAEIAPDGRALVGAGPELRLWNQDAWTSLMKEAGHGILWNCGFGADGRPWTEGNGARRVFDADGRETATKIKSGPQNHALKEGEWPDWLAAVLDEKSALAARQDSEGVWWVSQRGELWKGWDGDVVRIFAADEPSPFRKDGGVGFRAIQVDPSGGRLFESWPRILLPPGRGPEVSLEWRRNENPLTDRIGRVAGTDVYFYRWRVDGGEWRRSAPDKLLHLRELPRGEHLLEVAAFSPRLDAGPVLRERFRVDYKVSRRIRELLDRLHRAGASERTEVVRRLAAHGVDAEAAVKKRIAAEADEDRRWWLRAALQAIEDRREAGGQNRQ